MVILLSKPKYRLGKQIKTIADFSNSKCTYFKVYFGNGYKTKHRAFLISWQYRTLETFINRGHVFETETIIHPKACPICKKIPVRKQLHFKLEEGEDRYKCEHHEDGSLKWTYLQCPKCGMRTDAYCYEYQSTQMWNRNICDFYNGEIS